MAQPISRKPAPARTRRWFTTPPATTTAPAMMGIDSACPSAIGGSAQKTVPRLLRCRPSATANSHPIAGLRPWKAPSPASTSQGHSAVMIPPLRRRQTLRIAIGVRRAIAAFQPDLVRTTRMRPRDEELLVEGDTDDAPAVEFDSPALEPLGLELIAD